MKRKRKGFVAIVVFFLVIALALAVAPIIMQNISFFALSEPERAFFLGESGIHYYVKSQLPLSDSDWSNNTATITGTFGGGSFTVYVPAGGASTNSVKLRSIGSIIVGATTFNREIEYVARRINPFSYLFYGEGDATFEHINNGDLTGDGYVGGEFDTEMDNNLTLDGEIEDNQPDVDIPEVDWAYWQGEADYIIPGGRSEAELNALGIKTNGGVYEFYVTSYNGIYYVNGNATLDNNNIDFDGSLFVTGDLGSTQNNNVEITPDSGQPALVAGGSLNIGQGNNMIINGTVYAGNNLTLDQANNLTLNGSLIFGGDFFADSTNNIIFDFVEGDGTGFTGGQQRHGLRSFKEIGG